MVEKENKGLLLESEGELDELKSKKRELWSWELDKRNMGNGESLEIRMDWRSDLWRCILNGKEESRLTSCSAYHENWKLDHNTNMHFVWKNYREKYKVGIQEHVCETHTVKAMDNKGNQYLYFWVIWWNVQQIFQWRFHGEIGI